MKSSKSSIRYAQALLDLAIEQNKLDAIAGDMNYMAQTCDENRDLTLMLESPIVKSDKKIEVLNAIFDQFDTTSKAFVELITKNRREAHLPAIASSFGSLLKTHRGIVPITVVSATALNDQVRLEIIAKIQGTVKGTLEIEEKIDASLIGGFIVKMGDTQIDASVASQLNNLKQRLTR